MIKKEWRFMDKEFRQYRSNQGRSPEKMEKIYKGCFVIGFGGLVMFIIVLLSSL